MTTQSPSAALTSKANREQAKLVRCYDELNKISVYVKDSDVLPDVKLRLYAALKAEYELLQSEQSRVAGFRKAAELSRGPQWVTHSE